ncbi:conserved exported protein of unknown function [Tenacibaculum sp. 190130A14a]|uniref:His_kinase domain-containing protein n=1 Tax=Tenacibaculum polynesiense TaxID=3137857 RepID=A0ABP1F4H0_9FLAO
MIAFKKILTVLFILCTATIAAQNSLVHYTSTNDLPSNSIKDITQDSIGYLWFATHKGLAQFDGKTFTSLKKENGLISNKIQKVYAKNQKLYIGTDKGLSIKKGNQFINFECKSIHAIIAHNNEVFVGTSLGIYTLKEDYLGRLKIHDSLDLSEINDIQFDGTYFWVATNKALWKVDNLNAPKLVDKITNNTTSQLIIKDRKVVAATHTNGVVLFDNKVIQLTDTPKYISSIAYTQSNIWISTFNDGIEKLNTDFSFSNKLNKYNGSIPTNKINKLFVDTHQNVWIATDNKGVFKYRNPGTYNTQNPIIAFEDIQVVYKSIDSININNYTKEFQLPPNKNHLSFTFKTVDIEKPKHVQYRYKLNDQTSPWGLKNSVNFANLSSGKYTFLVESKINNKVSNPISFQFFIDKPIYEKIWFQWIASSIIFLLIGFFIYKRIRKIKAKDRAKIEKLQLENHLLSLEQKALQLQMNPHFIFNVLNGIKALGNAGKTLELNNTISKFSSLLRAILQNSRLEEISLQDEVNTLQNYVELEQQLNNDSFSFSIEQNLNIDIEEILVPPMLMQPFIENSIKHGLKNRAQGHITLEFSVFNQFLYCTIIDNGVGYYESQKTKGHKKHHSLAIKVTKERIENLSGSHSFTISELKEKNTVKGTKVWFKIPLKTDF